MGATGSWSTSIGDNLGALASAAAESAPAILAALVILALGWLVARLVRRGVRRLTNPLNALLDQLFRRGMLAAVRFSPGATVILGEVAFWLILLLAAALSARTAGLVVVADWLGGIVAYLPAVLFGAAIIALGFVLSTLGGQKVEAAAEAVQSGQSVLLGKIAQVGIFISALVIGLGQMGLDVTILVVFFTVTLGAVVAGIAIAFGFGARDHVANLIGARAARRELDVGQEVRIDNVEGTVLEITRTHIVLDTVRGRMLVPTRLVDLQQVELTAAEPEGERGND